MLHHHWQARRLPHRENQGPEPVAHDGGMDCRAGIPFDCRSGQAHARLSIPGRRGWASFAKASKPVVAPPYNLWGHSMLCPYERMRCPSRSSSYVNVNRNN